MHDLAGACVWRHQRRDDRLVPRAPSAAACVRLAPGIRNGRPWAQRVLRAPAGYVRGDCRNLFGPEGHRTVFSRPRDPTVFWRALTVGASMLAMEVNDDAG